MCVGHYYSHQISHPDREPLTPAALNTTTIPCHHIRLGDILVLQGHICQVIRVATNVTTGQHRYLGVGLFTKQLYEEGSFVSNPAPNVVVQYMLSPIFRQYYVLDMVDGMLVCMTETGDVVKNVPVIDQSSFWDRLKTAFLSKKGSLRVLVVQNNDRTLAVDMKVVRGSRLDGLPGTDGTASAKPRPDDGKTELHMACRAINEPLLKSILLRGKTDVNTLDKEQRTALFDSVDSCFESGVRALLETSINLEAMDTNGKTALDLALSRTDSSSQFIAMLLLQKGASPVAGLGNATQEFLSAAAEGDASAIIRLIQVDGASVNCHDRLGYTPLHEAVSFGRVEVVELLLQFGADVNAELCLGGDTPLHLIIDRGEAHRPFYGSVSERSSLPPLRGDHVALIEILLRRGAVASIARFSDGATAQELAAQRLSSERTEVEKTILRKLVSVLNSPPSVQLLAAETELEDRPLVTITGEARNICDNFSVRLQYHKTGAFLPRQSPIGSFIYLPECPTAKKCIGDLERWASKGSSGQSNPAGGSEMKDLWKWIHLPANRVWLPLLIIHHFDSGVYFVANSNSHSRKGGPR